MASEAPTLAKIICARLEEGGEFAPPPPALNVLMLTFLCVGQTSGSPPPRLSEVSWPQSSLRLGEREKLCSSGSKVSL